MTFLRADDALIRFCCHSVFGLEPHTVDCKRPHSCDDPIRCQTCLAQRAVRATARSAAARKGARRR